MNGAACDISLSPKFSLLYLKDQLLPLSLGGTHFFHMHDSNVFMDHSGLDLAANLKTLLRIPPDVVPPQESRRLLISFWILVQVHPPFANGRCAYSAHSPVKLSRSQRGTGFFRPRIESNPPLRKVGTHRTLATTVFNFRKALIRIWTIVFTTRFSYYKLQL